MTLRAAIVSITIFASLAAMSTASAVEPSPREETRTSNWTSFRNGGTSTLEKSRFPSQFGAGAIRWERELPGYGQSAPVLFKGRLYVAAVEGDRKEKLLLLAFDAEAGEPIWRKEFEASATAPSNFAVARAAPTPCVDERGLYAFFESGDLLALSHAGEVLWSRSLTQEFGPFENHHGVGASPAQDAQAIYVNVQHDGPSYLIAIDKRTGETKWKIDRPSRKCWNSPVVAELAGRRQVVVSATGSVAGYDAATGEALWTVDDLAGNSVASAVILRNRVYIGADLSDFDPVDRVRKSNRCIQVTHDGDAFRAETIWRTERALSHYASPLVHAGNVYYIDKRGVVTCVSAEDGTERYVERLESLCWTTPIAAGDRLFFFGKDGSVAALKAGDAFELLGVSRLWDPSNAPKPETYREYVESTSPARGSEAGKAEGSSGESRSGSMFANLLKGDANGDGELTAEELPERFAGMLETGDADKNGALSASELEGLEKAFRRKRSESRGESADPIVYGVAATEEAFYVRTGTRLYAIVAP